MIGVGILGFGTEFLGLKGIWEEISGLEMPEEGGIRGFLLFFFPLIPNFSHFFPRECQ